VWGGPVGIVTDATHSSPPAFHIRVILDFDRIKGDINKLLRLVYFTMPQFPVASKDKGLARLLRFVSALVSSLSDISHIPFARPLTEAVTAFLGTAQVTSLTFLLCRCSCYYCSPSAQTKINAQTCWNGYT
jgi:hypothetical protein